MPPARTSSTRRKIVAFDEQTWQAIDLLARDSFKSFQELADEAFRDLLKKHRRPTDLKAALKASAAGVRVEPVSHGRRSRSARRSV